ncbi:diguanylate cyclase [Spirulina subsalsa FACHB-351]|uniref:Diguanylate cyclase n=1 Tax=Spirulina subsalsa FACHB-351 TaxID=234711 RepID=A0ABT3L0A1_9CYAN|nr:diguanylate cyclase [Spirulina subsalsa]MCW6034923.1 diguanylate cyclase [Spirulina subsalsa FACHB-351]
MTHSPLPACWCADANLQASLSKQDLAAWRDYIALQELVTRLPIVIWLMSPDLKQLFYKSPGCEVLWDVPSSTETGCFWLTGILDEDAEQVTFTQEQALDKGILKDTVELEYRMVDPQNRTCWVSVRLFPIRDAEGKVEGVAGIGEDITQRKNTEDALKYIIHQQTLVNAIAQRIRRSLEIEAILETTVQEVQNLLLCDRAFLYRLDFDWSGTVVVEALRSPDYSLLGRRLTDTEFIANYVELYQKGRIHVVDDVRQSNLSECYIHWLTDLQVRANLVVPVLHDEELWGMLVVQECEQPRSWQAFEIELLQQLAVQVAIAIQQAELLEELKTTNTELQQLATLDSLTQVGNRRCFDEALPQEWEKMALSQAYLSLVLVDVDFFKAYNDTYGHPAGDECLRTVAQTLRTAVKRSTDLVTRYGGEEFAILLPHTDANGAVQVAGEILSRVRKLKIPHCQSKVSNHITVSVGIITTIPHPGLSYEDFVKRGDQALYEAKHQGRDRMIFAEYPEFLA